MRRFSVSYGMQSAQLKVRQHRQVHGTVKTLQLKREHRRWYVIVTTETEPVPLPPTGQAVGVDVGVVRFLTTSDGEVIANPRILAKSAEVIADLQRRMAHARPGSGNRRRLRRALAMSMRHGTYSPGPGWALVGLHRQLEKLPPSGGRAVTCL